MFLADLFIVHIIRNPPLHHLLDTLTRIPPHENDYLYIPIKESKGTYCNLDSILRGCSYFRDCLGIQKKTDVLYLLDWGYQGQSWLPF